MMGPRRAGALLTALIVLVFLANPAVRAQTACRTANCVQNGLPPPCANRAAPRIPTVLMTTDPTTFSYVFKPADPRIEPGDCIEWKDDGDTHNSSADPCPDDVLTSCTAPSPSSCKWETGNVSPIDVPPSVVCYYNPGPTFFPPGTGAGYYCRIHDNPSHTGTMHGTLRVTTPIVLTVDKDSAAGDVVLSWSGGGISGDVTYKVVRNAIGDPSFPPATTQTCDPSGGSTGTSYRDIVELNILQARYYLVRNKQTNE